MIWVIHIVHIAVNDQKQFVFELISGAGVGCWIEKTKFSYIQVGNMKSMGYSPFITMVHQYYYCMKLGYKSHKLSSDTGI